MNVLEVLDKYYHLYHKIDFLEHDPLQIPHGFQKKQDIEISAFFASIFAWGKRKIIIDKSKLLLDLMDNAPHDFVRYYMPNDAKKLINFCHRTFNHIDLLYFLGFLKRHYAKYESLENAFSDFMKPEDTDVENALKGFYTYFCADDTFPIRTRKHVSTPANKSACKRLNMFLRWMVRVDDAGLDFGIWQKIKPSQLICPYDVHVERNASMLGLVPDDHKANWKNALCLTQNLRKFDAEDPIKYDFALFGMGVNGIED